jgi:hypothetical protein
LALAFGIVLGFVLLDYLGKEKRRKAALAAQSSSQDSTARIEN